MLIKTFLFSTLEKYIICILHQREEDAEGLVGPTKMNETGVLYLRNIVLHTEEEF